MRKQFTKPESPLRRLLREGAPVVTVDLAAQGIAVAPVTGRCEHVMKRPPTNANKVVAVGSRTWKRDDGKAWKRGCPNRATVEVNGKKYCAAHAPG